MLTEENIYDVAEHLEMGYNCYYHIHTGNIIKIPNVDLDDLDEDAYSAEMEELEENFMEYKSIEKMDSVFSFQMMESFIQVLDDTNTVKSLLLNAISKPKPFRQFKDVLDNEEQVKEMWREHRQQMIMGWVRNQLKRNSK